MENNEGKLRKVPECGIFDFNDKIESIPADTLSTTQAKREYLAHVWAKYKNASKQAPRTQALFYFIGELSFGSLQ